MYADDHGDERDRKRGDAEVLMPDGEPLIEPGCREVGQEEGRVGTEEEGREPGDLHDQSFAESADGRPQ